MNEFIKWEFKPPQPTITLDDTQAFFEVIKDAWEVHLDRERVRHGLWKKYSALDQMRQVKIKAERVMHGLENPQATQTPDFVLPEIPDIINYSIFAHRILEGKI